MTTADEDDAAVVKVSGADDFADLWEGSWLEVVLWAGVEGVGPGMVDVI